MLSEEMYFFAALPLKIRLELTPYCQIGAEHDCLMILLMMLLTLESNVAEQFHHISLYTFVRSSNHLWSERNRFGLTTNILRRQPSRT
jgi:hypothetical protein